MFYAPEILSYRNKTELSLVYYISTAKNPKRFARKDVVALDVESILDQMKNPKIPFALRLYSYLLKGIVKIWVMKVDFYKNKAEHLLSAKDTANKLPKKREVGIFKSDINLRIVDEVMSDLDECSSNMNVRQDIFSDFSAGGISNTGMLANAGILEGIGMCHPAVFTDINSIDGFGESLNSYIPAIRKNKVDKTIEISSEEIILKKIKTNNYEMPNLIDCYIVQHFEKLISTPMDIEQHNDLFDFDQVSVEDPRISSSLSQEKNLVEKERIKEEETKAIWFYNILVSASKGEIRVYQDSPFAELIIE